MNSPSICQEHQKPLSYYNKYKPNNPPICADCLIREVKEGNNTNLYLPSANLEQEYYYQKNAFFQIIEQANNMKKFDSHIANFYHLLTSFFGQFITKFLKEKILACNSNAFNAYNKFDIEKNNNCLNAKDIMVILNKVEQEKYVLENKTADVFSNINKLQRILIRNHDKLANGFKNLLYNFFDNSNNEMSAGKNYQKENSSNPLGTGKNSVTNSSAQKKQDFLTSPKYESQSPNNNLSQISPIEEKKQNNETNNFAPNININMEKEKVFDDNIEFDPEKDKKDFNTTKEINNSFQENKFTEIFNQKNEEVNQTNAKEENEHELEWRKKKSDEEALAWRRKNDEDDDICKEHKDKINKLIEQDKNKKSGNQSFFQTKKPNFKKKYNLNKSFQKYNPAKFNFSKKIEYKQYNQFLQKTCSKCGSSFITTKDEEFCQNCKHFLDKDDRRGIRNYSNKNEKYRFFPKNFGGPKKSFIQNNRQGIKKFFGKRNDRSFTSRQYMNKTLIHSNSNFLNRYGNGIGSPKGFDEHKKFNINGKYRINKIKENNEQKFGKNNFVQRNCHDKINKDNFEVDDLESDNDENDKDNNSSKREKTFFKSSNDFFRKNSQKKNDDNSMEINENDSDSENESENKGNSQKNNKSNKSNSNDSNSQKEMSEKESNNDDINEDHDDENNMEKEDDEDSDSDKDNEEHNDDRNGDDFEADF